MECPSGPVNFKSLVYAVGCVTVSVEGISISAGLISCGIQYETERINISYKPSECLRIIAKFSAQKLKGLEQAFFSNHIPQCPR